MNFISPSFRANERSATNQSREASSRVFTRWRMSSLLLPRAVARERCELGSAEDLIMLGRGKRGKFDENFSTTFVKYFARGRYREDWSSWLRHSLDPYFCLYSFQEKLVEYESKWKIISCATRFWIWRGIFLPFNWRGIRGTLKLVKTLWLFDQASRLKNWAYFLVKWFRQYTAIGPRIASSVTKSTYDLFVWVVAIPNCGCKIKQIASAVFRHQERRGVHFPTGGWERDYNRAVHCVGQSVKKWYGATHLHGGVKKIFCERSCMLSLRGLAKSNWRKFMLIISMTSSTICTSYRVQVRYRNWRQKIQSAMIDEEVWIWFSHAAFAFFFVSRTGRKSPPS